VAEGQSLVAALPLLFTAPGQPLRANTAFSADARPKALGPRDFGAAGVAGAAIRVLTPSQVRLDALRVKWATDSGNAAQLQAAVRFGIDKSVANLSSITFLMTVEGRKLLLTGDGLAPDMVEGWQAFPGAGAVEKVDVMKVPHHGSTANNTEAFFRMFPARHYVFCANGKHDNPDIETLKLLFKVRNRGKYTLHMTSPRGTPGIAAQEALIDAEAARTKGRVSVSYRAAQERSIRIAL
jgi:hypothetical protein